MPSLLGSSLILGDGARSEIGPAIGLGGDGPGLCSEVQLWALSRTPSSAEVQRSLDFKLGDNSGVAALAQTFPPQGKGSLVARMQGAPPLVGVQPRSPPRACVGNSGNPVVRMRSSVSEPAQFSGPSGGNGQALMTVATWSAWHSQSPGAGLRKVMSPALNFLC